MNSKLQFLSRGSLTRFESLGAKLAVLIAMLLAVISVFIFLYFPDRQERQAIEDTREKVSLLTDVTARSMETNITFADPTAMREDLVSLRTIPDLAFVRVVNDSGAVLLQFRRDSALISRELRAKVVDHITQDGRLFLWQSPVIHDGKEIGLVEIGFSLDDLRAELSLSRAGIALVGVAVFAYGMIAVLAIGRYLTRPLKEMVLVAERISSGELNERAVANSNDEVGQLAKSFNRMVTNLQEALAKLKQFNDTLEARVKDRTTELEREILVRRKTEEELKAALVEAERAQKVKSAFISNMSHEIRTPLNVIMGYSNLLREELGDRARPEELRYFESIHRGGERLMRTVGDIMSISRIEAGDIRLNNQRLDLVELARAATFDLRPTAEKKTLELRFESEYTAAFVVADSYCVMQALTNLIDNAIKYTREGSITVGLTAEEKGVKLSVMDTGIGIGAEYLPYLFDPYTQEDSGIGRSYEGIGLGLTLVRKYCELQGVEIDVASEKEVGSTFSMSFREAELTANTQPTQSTPTESVNLDMNSDVTPHFGTPLIPATAAVAIPAKDSILIVEDDPASQAYLQLILRKHYNILRAESYEQAIALLQEQDFVVMVTDISLAGAEDGLTLIRYVKAARHFDHMPVIALTAHVFPEDRKRIMEAGCDEFVTKPIMKDDLLAAIGRVLAKFV